ncbi:hypothetical protein PR202_ga28928 [Eleusine coracana subsp. coracana]|uniref:Rho-GAP domain-containing protein n=1 Tax=Eleusine coracana subsp. coracana TaxID=191504 RepID=A0AAV5DJU9_ELECO|nr:hypothetical protein PR202_ga28928 [Eleusine coracana subsp. coracana]
MAARRRWLHLGRPSGRRAAVRRRRAAARWFAVSVVGNFFGFELRPEMARMKQCCFRWTTWFQCAPGSSGVGAAAAAGFGFERRVRWGPWDLGISSSVFSTLPQRSGEVSLTLGGIDLNNFWEAETSEDLFEWKTALEEALAQAPNAALVMGHNGIFPSNPTDAYEGAIPNWREKRPIKSLVVGRPILLALEDIDGSPSFLEKALRFLEKHGIKVEGILRKSAGADEVDKRLREYEQGRTEFAPDEDAHVIGDCVKRVLRELPSSPVPASCCTALLEAFYLEIKESRINCMRTAISETFPEPNRRLLQRILRMMHTIASHSTENRMTPSAVAVCMAPLLLRPLLAGECEMEDDFDMSGDSSAQLIAAVNAANSAHGIVTILLEEYESIFDDEHLRCSLSPNSQTGDSVSEESTDDETVDVKDSGFHDAENDVDQELDDAERILSGKLSESSTCTGGDIYDCKVIHDVDSDGKPSVGDKALEAKIDLNDALPNQSTENGLASVQSMNENDTSKLVDSHGTPLSMGDILSSLDAGISVDKHSSKPNGTQQHVKRSNIWGRNSARKSQQSELVDSSGEEELAIQRLEVTKNDLQIRITKEVSKEKAYAYQTIISCKLTGYCSRLEVSRLQEQLQAERDLRAALEVGLSMSSSQFSSSHSMDSKAELEEIALAEAGVAKLKQKVAELHLQLTQQQQHQDESLIDVNDHSQHLPSHLPQNFVQPGFDINVAFCNQGKKQRNEESLMGTSHWRSIKQHVLTHGSSRPFSRKHSLEAPSGDPREASISMSADNGLMSLNIPRAAEGVENGRQLAVPSSTLVELTTRLDFFKERRSQLMEQLHSLDLGHGSASHGFPYKSSSPWNGPRGCW